MENLINFLGDDGITLVLFVIMVAAFFASTVTSPTYSRLLLPPSEAADLLAHAKPKYTGAFSLFISNQYNQTYFSLVIYLVLAVALCGLLAGLAYLFSISTAQETEKRSEYECGFAPFDSATRLPFDVHFYLVGILFLIFDVEVALLFPWVLSLRTVGWFGFYLMFAFLFILSVGFLYEWKRGALIWPTRYSKTAKPPQIINGIPFIFIEIPYWPFVLALLVYGLLLYYIASKEDLKTKIIGMLCAAPAVYLYIWPVVGDVVLTTLRFYVALIRPVKHTWPARFLFIIVLLNCLAPLFKFVTGKVENLPTKQFQVLVNYFWCFALAVFYVSLHYSYLLFFAAAFTARVSLYLEGNPFFPREAFSRAKYRLLAFPMRALQDPLHTVKRFWTVVLYLTLGLFVVFFAHNVYHIKLGTPVFTYRNLLLTLDGSPHFFYELYSVRADLVSQLKTALVDGFNTVVNYAIILPVSVFITHFSPFSDNLRFPNALAALLIFLVSYSAYYVYIFKPYPAFLHPRIDPHLSDRISSTQRFILRKIKPFLAPLLLAALLFTNLPDYLGINVPDYYLTFVNYSIPHFITVKAPNFLLLDLPYILFVILPEIITVDFPHWLLVDIPLFLVVEIPNIPGYLVQAFTFLIATYYDLIDWTVAQYHAALIKLTEARQLAWHYRWYFLLPPVWWRGAQFIEYGHNPYRGYIKGFFQYLFGQFLWTIVVPFDPVFKLIGRIYRRFRAIQKLAAKRLKEVEATVEAAKKDEESTKAATTTQKPNKFLPVLAAILTDEAAAALKQKAKRKFLNFEERSALRERAQFELDVEKQYHSNFEAQYQPTKEAIESLPICSKRPGEPILPEDFISTQPPAVLDYNRTSSSIINNVVDAIDYLLSWVFSPALYRESLCNAAGFLYNTLRTSYIPALEFFSLGHTVAIGYWLSLVVPALLAAVAFNLRRRRGLANLQAMRQGLPTLPGSTPATKTLPRVVIAIAVAALAYILLLGLFLQLIHFELNDLPKVAVATVLLPVTILITVVYVLVLINSFFVDILLIISARALARAKKEKAAKARAAKIASVKQYEEEASAKPATTEKTGNTPFAPLLLLATDLFDGFEPLKKALLPAEAPALAMVPEAFLFALICALLVYLSTDLGKAHNKRLLARTAWTAFSFGFLAVAAIYVYQFFFILEEANILGGYFVTSRTTTLLKLVTLLSALFILDASETFMRRHDRHLLEYPVMLALTTFFMLLLVSANHVMSSFLSLVGFSLGLYVLILYDANQRPSREAGLKYYYLSTLSSGFILYGFLLIYSLTGAGNFDALLEIFTTKIFIANHPILLLAVVFILGGFFFKLSAFPGHLWAADVYEGSPAPVTGFFMLPVKIAVLGGFIRLFTVALATAAPYWLPVLTGAVVVSILWGAFAAVQEKKVRRFLAYASINQMGFLLMGLTSDSAEGIQAALIYILVYAVMTCALLTIFLSARREDGSELLYLSDFRTLASRNWLVGWSLAVVLFSMAGIPPLGGFFAKYFVLLHAFEKGLMLEVIVGLATSLISTYYYLRIIKIVKFEQPDGAMPSSPALTPRRQAQLFLAEALLWSFMVFAPAIIGLTRTLVLDRGLADVSF